jgi:hypothetical protein
VMPTDVERLLDLANLTMISNPMAHCGNTRCVGAAAATSPDTCDSQRQALMLLCCLKELRQVSDMPRLVVVPYVCPQ